MPTTPEKEKFFTWMVALLGTIKETNGYWTTVKFIDRQHEILRQLPSDTHVPAFFVNEAEEQFTTLPARKRNSQVVYSVVGVVRTTDSSEGASDIHTKLNRLQADFLNAFDADFQLETISSGAIHLVDHHVERIATDEGILYPYGIFVAQCRASLRYNAGSA